MTLLKLTKNMRIHTDDINFDEKQKFADYLLRIGSGEEITLSIETNKIELSKNICMDTYNLNNFI